MNCPRFSVLAIAVAIALGFGVPVEAGVADSAHYSLTYGIAAPSGAPASSPHYTTTNLIRTQGASHGAYRVEFQLHD